MNKFKHSALPWLLLSALIILVDQYSKYYAMHHLQFLNPTSINPFFNLVLNFNLGAAFSFLSLASGWQRWFFVGIALAVCTFILIWMRHTPRNHYLLSIGFALIFGGALGNVWDRIRFGYVIDFIDWHIQTWHWPTFNLADSAICIGVGLLVIDFLVRKK